MASGISFFRSEPKANLANREGKHVATNLAFVHSVYLNDHIKKNKTMCTVIVNMDKQVLENKKS